MNHLAWEIGDDLLHRIANADGVALCRAHHALADSAKDDEATFLIEKVEHERSFGVLGHVRVHVPKAAPDLTSAIRNEGGVIRRHGVQLFARKDPRDDKQIRFARGGFGDSALSEAGFQSIT